LNRFDFTIANINTDAVAITNAHLLGALVKVLPVESAIPLIKYASSFLIETMQLMLTSVGTVSSTVLSPTPQFWALMLSWLNAPIL
jgi:hypothetical protein